MTQIGQCTFEQLPEKYQTLFTEGINDVEDGTFSPQASPTANMILSILFVGFFALIPPLFLSDVDPNAAWFSLLGLLARLPLLGVGAVAINTYLKLAKVRQKGKEGLHLYGLLMDDEALVRRELTLINRKNCFFMPRDRVVDFSLKRSTGSSTNQFKDGPSFLVAYNDKQNKKRWVTLVADNDVELSLFAIHKLFLIDDKSIDGEWSYAKPSHAKPKIDLTVEFHEPHGEAAEWEAGKKLVRFPFTFRQTGHRIIVVESVQGDRAWHRDVQPGTYSFNIEIEHYSQGSFYMLRFDQPFFASRSPGARPWSFGQKR
ncbi:MAG: hypothetical protein AAF614_12505 [Chloroflexota bacterium]